MCRYSFWVGMHSALGICNFIIGVMVGNPITVGVAFGCGLVAYANYRALKSNQGPA